MRTFKSWKKFEKPGNILKKRVATLYIKKLEQLQNILLTRETHQVFPYLFFIHTP